MLTAKKFQIDKNTKEIIFSYPYDIMLPDNSIINGDEIFLV